MDLEHLTSSCSPVLGPCKLAPPPEGGQGAGKDNHFHSPGQLHGHPRPEGMPTSFHVKSGQVQRSLDVVSSSPRVRAKMQAQAGRETSGTVCSSLGAQGVGDLAP
jgi:hypothetical protein